MMTYVFQNRQSPKDMIAIHASNGWDAEKKLSAHVFGYRYGLLSVNKVALEDYKFPYGSIGEIKTEISRRNY